MSNTTETNREKRKADLEASAESYLANIQTQLGDFKELGKNALAIGGIVLGAYLITRLFVSTNEETIQEETQNKEEDSIILAGFKGIATAVLLAILKDKLMELIEYITENDAEISTK
jgi:hypothetical protein